MYGWCYPPNKIKWRTMHTIIFITWFYNLLSASENLIWPFPTHLPLLGLFLPFHISRHLPTAVLFSSFRVTHGKNYGGVFFFRRSICKIGIFASELAEVGQAGGTTLCSGSWAQVPTQPTSVTTAPLHTGMGLSVIPAARYLSALHSTHTRKWKGCFSCSHRVWTLLSRGCETPQCFVLLTVGFWPVSNASPKKTPTQTSYTIQIVGWEMPVPQLWINQM